MAEQETLGQLITRRMDDLRIESFAELGRRIDKTRSYAAKLGSDKVQSNGKRYVPARDVLRKLASELAVPEPEILRAAGLLPPLAPAKNPEDDIRQAGFAFFGGGRDLSTEDWEEVIAMTKTLIAEKERRRKKKS